MRRPVQRHCIPYIDFVRQPHYLILVIPNMSQPHDGSWQAAAPHKRYNTKRNNRWPAASETRADPNRWATDWTSEQNAIETTADLADWNGEWAPAPINWDSRPSFNDNNMHPRVDKWIEESVPAAQSTKSLVIVETLNGVGIFAPRDWIATSLWHDALKSPPLPVDESDLDNAKPFWECYTGESDILAELKHPPVLIDPLEDPEETIARQADHGSDQHTANRKRLEKAKAAAIQDRKKTEHDKALRLGFTPLTLSDRINPDVKMYIRSALPSDIAEITAIYNHYVNNAYAPETEPRKQADMSQRLKSTVGAKLPFLVACERGAIIPVSKRDKRYEAEEITLPDKVIGFAHADDFHDMKGMYRFTAELEVYVSNMYYMKGVASCLLDKLLGLLDPGYLERGGYDTKGGDIAGAGAGAKRIVQNLIVNLPYEKPERLG